MIEQPQEIEAPLPICTGCNKHPAEIEEYVVMGEVEDMTPDDFVRQLEGTYNRSNGHFLCTACYIKAGQPSIAHPGRWITP